MGEPQLAAAVVASQQAVAPRRGCGRPVATAGSGAQARRQARGGGCPGRRGERARWSPSAKAPPKNDWQQTLPVLEGVKTAAPAVARGHPGNRAPPADRASLRTLKSQIWTRLRTLDSYCSRSAAAGVAPTEEAEAEVAMLKFALTELAPL